jgi:hypothetical protein
MYRYDVYPGHHPESRSARGQKSLADGCPFHALALRDTDLVLGHDSGSSVDGHNCSFITINYCLK